MQMRLGNRLPRLSALLATIVHKLAVDRTVFLSVITKSWSLSAGPITVLLIATNFTAELQGYYFTFATIVALQVFVELGLGTVITQFSSHEWARLRIDEIGRIVGDNDARSRLISIAALAAKWYLIGAAITIFGLGICGYAFFSSSATVGVNWIAPWFLLCLTTGFSICLVPVWALLEGCNQLVQLYTFRFVQGVVSSITVWVAIVMGAELWTPSISTIAAVFCSIVFLRSKYHQFLKTLFFSKVTGPKIIWWNDLFPMQWRVALTMVTGFLVNSFFVPVIFKFQGPTVAGQMGMTLSIMVAIGNLSFSWFTPKIPQFCMLVAERRYQELDRLFFDSSIRTLIIMLIASFALFFAIYAINITGLSLANRLLPPMCAGIFILGTLVNSVSAPFSHFMRAHKQEPIVHITVGGSILIGVGTFVTAKYLSVTHMAISYLIINILITPSIIAVWYRTRKKWRQKYIE